MLDFLQHLLMNGEHAAGNLAHAALSQLPFIAQDTYAPGSPKEVPEPGGSQFTVNGKPGPIPAWNTAGRILMNPPGSEFMPQVQWQNPLPSSFVRPTQPDAASNPPPGPFNVPIYLTPARPLQQSQRQTI